MGGAASDSICLCVVFHSPQKAHPRPWRREAVRGPSAPIRECGFFLPSHREAC